jgi:hypothetical protein
VENVVTYAHSVHLCVVLGNVSTLSPTPQIVEGVAVYVMSLASWVNVIMGVDESMIFGFIISSPTNPRCKEYLHC